MTSQNFQNTHWQTRPKTRILDVNKYMEIENALAVKYF